MYFLEDRIKRILLEVEKYICPDSESIPSYKMKEGNFPGGGQKFLDTTGWSTFTTGERWGGRDRNFWFRTDITIPARFAGKTVVYRMKTGREGDWDALNPQFLIYINGNPVQALDVNHKEVLLSEKAVSGESYTIALFAYSGMKEGLVELISSMAVLDREVEKLYYNIKVPLEVAALLEQEDKKRIDILHYLNDAINLLDLRKPFSQEFNASVKEANDFLEKEFYGKYCGNEDVVAVSVGHTHIDVAWLWTLAQTRQKTARSFATVLELMKQYPEYIFMSSQPQLYKFLKEDHPEIYEEVKKKVKEGRWEAEGAMWLEADCNIASGEALVRQVLFGTRFFREEFGIENKILWLPDVFGYSAALPQILKKSGIDYFMTTKISWNEYNKLPYDTFMWKGMDGTEILTHFITTKNYEKGGQKSHRTTYNGNLVPSQVMGAWQRYQHKELTNEVLISFGYGDGGGGPTKEMLENARRMEKGIPGCPKVQIGNSLDFFRRLEKKVSNHRMLPKWVGELYLEYHRGTYTSMARNKKFNRKSELLYQDAELLSILGRETAGLAYPQQQLNQGWETILLNQFHDILPGSSIKEVYEDSREQYLEVLDAGKGIVKNAVDAIASKINLEAASVVVFNQLGFIRNDVVEFDLPEGYEGVEVRDASGKVLPSQMVCTSPRAGSAAGCCTGNQTCKVIFYAEDVPAKGYKAFTLKNVPHNTAAAPAAAAGACCGQDLRCSKESLENRFYHIKLDANGHILSIFDKVNHREVLKAGKKANVIQAFEDKPHRHDAWDINIYYQEKMWEINDVESMEIVEKGPVRTCLRIRRNFLDSVLVQDVYIYNDIPRIDFASFIDWKEKQILVKAAFPVDVHSDKATYEIQYGNVERPTHWNTSWDFARFEVCAHKWADLSEDGYGVSLLNDCKYGYDIKDEVMRLTLLKSAESPNVDADREVHEFTYSLYPHAGDWKAAGTVQMAYSLNCPMYVKVEAAHQGTLPASFSLVRIDRDNVVVEVVKKAEDSNDTIVRVYECNNRRSTASLTFYKALSEVRECDLMERDLESLQVEGSRFSFEIKPYEIKTFRLRA